MNLQLKKTDSSDEDFVALVSQLDHYLAILDGDDNAFYSQYNKIDKLKHVIVVYDNDRAVGCGAIKEFEPGVMEIKRMFILPELRGKGIASFILSGLEQWAPQLSCHTLILETGRNNPGAMALYERNGYNERPNFPPYAGVENSICYEKQV